jgi:ATP-dependent helicase/nuclease subunit B
VERTQRNAAREVWPTPRVRDFSSWLREQYLKRQLEDADSPRLLGEAEERELWRGVIDATELGRDMLDPAGAARAARHARRTLSDYGIPLKALMGEGSDEVRAFLDWNGAFEEQCRALKCISADTLLDGIAAPNAPVTWIESPAWRPAVRQWLFRHGRTLTPRAATSHPASFVHAPSPAAELAAIAEWSRTNLRACPEFRAWVCVPDLAARRAEVVDALDAVLAPQRFGLGDSGTAPYAVAGGTPLADYAPVRAALEALAVGIGTIAFARFSALLRSPELQANHAEAGAAARLDLALRNRASSDAELRAWLELAESVARREEIGAVPALQRLQALQRAAGEMRGTHRFSVWIPIWMGALEAGPWALRGRWSSTEYQAAERFRELLATLATADALLGTHSWESALRVLRRAARDTAFQVQTGVAAVWVSGQLIDPWLNYDGLWVAGCDDARWPPPIAPVALLPVGLQRQYGVIAASAESQLATAVDLQNRWQLRAGQCVFSYADAPDGTKSMPSPLLPRNEALLLTAMPPAPQPHWRELFQSAPVMEHLSDERAPPFSASVERTRGVSSLRAQSRCAFRGFAETRLDAHRLEPLVPGFNEHERGILVHEALEHVWTILPGSDALHSLSSDAQQRLLNVAARRAIEKVCRKRDPGPKWRRREHARLQNLLGKWLDIERTRAPFTVEALEQGAADVHFGGLDFRVRIDRVDRLADGARVLLDYKTGAASADWRGERPDNPQLPVYALVLPEALVAVAYARVNAGEPGFVAEVERRGVFKPDGRPSSLEGMTDFADLVRTWSLRVERIAAEFAAGRAEVAPTLKACKNCDLQGLCRVPAALEPDDE